MPEFDPNEEAIEEWIAATDGFDRVEAVIEETREPETAAEIAERAHVSESTARKHLVRLVGLNTANAVESGQTTRYVRNEDRYLMDRIQELQRNRTNNELVREIAELKDEVDAYRERYGVESPEELALTSEFEDGPADPWSDVTEWQAARGNLARAQAALSFKRARDLAEV
ncbi:MAG: ArsR family transcriptional regulator [Euryarchaeota archaeon]|nr:ArsR family transcriptional regulator [Euryarchaeota archaeon]